MGKRFGILILLLVLSGIAFAVGSSRSDSGAESEATATLGSTGRLQNRVRVEVLNGSGESGLARAATGALRDQGFDVVSFGNAGTQSEEISVVMDRVGRMEMAQQVAEALGILHVRSEPDSTLFLDVTVRLGKDWEASPLVVMEEDDPPPWWDLRRFFRKSELENDLPEPSTDR